MRIGDYDGILIRSATKLDSEHAASGPSACGRWAGPGWGSTTSTSPPPPSAGSWSPTRPQSNVITAAEHTMALLLALARNIPQAHASLTGGAWERSKFSGVELYEKTLGIMGFGRIGQLVAQRARGFGMQVIAFDPYVGAERYRELGVEKADTPDDVYAVADFLTLHLPKTPETEGWLDARRPGQVQGRRPGPERRPRPAGRRRGPEGRARLRQGGRRRARRVPLRAGDRAPAVRLSQRDRHAAPGGVDRRGDRSRRLPGGRAGGGRAHRRRRSPAPSTCPAIPPRGHGGARALRAPVPLAGPDRDRAGRLRGRVGRPRPDRFLRPDWPIATRACWRSRCCSAYSPATPRRRSTRSTPPRSPRSAGIGVVETKHSERPRLHRLRPRRR